MVAAVIIAPSVILTAIVSPIIVSTSTIIIGQGRRGVREGGKRGKRAGKRQQQRQHARPVFPEEEHAIFQSAHCVQRIMKAHGDDIFLTWRVRIATCPFCEDRIVNGRYPMLPVRRQHAKQE